MYDKIVIAGVILSLLFSELTGLSAGLVVPGYLALSLHTPMRLVSTLAVAAASVLVCRLLSTRLILYGRRRYTMFLLTGAALKLAAAWLGFGTALSIGILIPGILGRDMERQHILPTLLSLGIVTMLTQLAVIAIHMF